MSLLMGYNGGAGPGGASGAGAPGDLLYQDVAVSPGIATVHDPLGQATDHHIEWHHHAVLTQDHCGHLQDLHSPYSMESDSAIGLSPSPDYSLDVLSSSSNNNNQCMSSGSSNGSKDAAVAASVVAVCGAADKKSRQQQQQQRRRRKTPPRHNIDANDNSLYAVYEFFKSFLSTSTASTVAIDNKIEQAMDLVKSHLMFAVREEVEVLKEKITELMERINQLEYENTVLKQYATNEALQQIQQHHNSNT